MAKAIDHVNAYLSNRARTVPVIVEARTLEEVQVILGKPNISRVLLDNMGLADLRQAVQLIGGALQTEASGGIKSGNLEQIAATGVDYISTSSLNRDIHSLDQSLKLG